ncbi:MAG: class I SAM-dependent methyltransferase [Porphyromonadaceae bacterium]|nr:MAG: class I SAM-dependent methyltransferase [Porphyromonadaceae bacterium]
MKFSLKSTAKLFLPKYQKLILEYKVDMKPRYGHESAVHPGLLHLIENVSYTDFLNQILTHKEIFFSLNLSENEPDENLPAWNNGFLPGLDIMALYTLIGYFQPAHYIEIGSGNSTKVARKAIKDNKLATLILSIDPFPRANIDHLADEIIRKPLEKMDDIGLISDRLGANDILFIDNSHRCLPNSDVTVCFLEILPLLKPGVIVEFHDIYLPWDYPPFLCDRFYSEQYMLAAFLLANPKKYQPIFPAWHISQTPELTGILDEIWNHPNLKNVEKHGGSFWIQIGD